MPEDERGHVVDEIHPLVTINVSDSRAVGLRYVDREWVPEDRVTRVAAREVAFSLFVLGV